ncbi:MAG: InlB B-repeat-containing protein [Clostridiales Family XIII bacterium]|nr:InlB B-repeat-containing protein [Clostridiales Family XIII bacterium]
MYATWAKGKFTATFDLNGHGAQAPPPQTVTFGDKVAEPAQPSDADWAFGGWFKDAACSPGAEWDFAKDTMPGGSITLYAKWTTDIHAYTVFFVMNGHGGSAPNPVRVTAGQRIPEPARPYDTNWAFGGWFTNMACSPGYEWNFATGTMPNSDMTLFAKWTEDSSGGGGNGGGSGGNNDKGKDKDKDKDKNKDSDKDKNSGKDNGRGKGNAGSNSSGSGGAGNGSGAGGGSGENGDDSNAEGGGGENGGSSNAEGGGEGTADGAIDGIAGDDDTYGEAGADNASGEGSEWNTNGGSAEAGDEENDQGGRSDEPMSVANILLMVAGVVIALRVATEARKRRYAKWPPPTIIALGAAGAILYFAIERIHSSWAITNSHTIYFAIIIAAQIAATIIARRSKVAG